MTNLKFNAFHADLVDLLDKYGYMLSTTLYDAIVVHDSTAGTRMAASPSPIYCGLVDDTVPPRAKIWCDGCSPDNCPGCKN